MEIHQLRYFVAAAEAGTISRAAAQLQIAQPSLSQQIRKLEESLGVSLFDRHGRGVLLTEAGRALLPRARRILSELRAATNELKTDLDQGRGHLAVGAIPTVAPYLLPPALAALRARCPDAMLTVVEDLTESLLARLTDNELDAAIISSPCDDPMIRLQPLAQEQLVLVTPATGPLAVRSRTVRFEEIRDLPRVGFHEMHCLGRQVAGFCTSRGASNAASCRTTQLGTLLEMVRLQLGVAIVPSLVARLDESSGRRYALFSDGPPVRELAIATRTGRSRPRLLDLLDEELRRALSVQHSGPGLAEPVPTDAGTAGVDSAGVPRLAAQHTFRIQPDPGD